MKQNIFALCTLSLVLLGTSCTEQPQTNLKTSNSPTTMVTPTTMTQAVVGSSCEANLFEPIEDGCEGRWSYRNPSECYEEARHPACGYELLPGSGLECDETRGVFVSYEDCSSNMLGDPYILSNTTELVEVRLVSEYMQVLYGSDSNAALTDIQNILGDACGAYGIKEIGEIAKQCAPLARGVGEQDELDDLLTSLGVITKTLDHIRACPQVSGNPLKSLEFRGTSAYLGLECRRQEDDFNRLASWLEQLRGCPSNATENLVATLMSTFYQHVASNLEEVVGQYCTPEAQQGVYIEIMEAIERYLGGAGWEEYIQDQLELQCEQKCRERLKYTNSDGEEVYMLDAECETSVANVTEASSESGAIFAGECQMTIRVPEEYQSYLSEKTCRTKENGVTDPSECGVDHAGEEVHYTGLGLEREQVLRMYEGEVVPQTLQCLTGDDIAVDWTNVSPLELSALKSRVLTGYLDRDATSGADGESMKDMLAARLMLLSELYGDGPLHKGESQADSKNRAFILNTAELYERHPNARPSCGPELDESGNCNQDGSATVNVTELSNSFAVGHGLSENSLFAYPLGIVSIPFGFHGYDFLMLDPTAPSPDTQSAGYAEFAVDRPTTVTILFDRAGANYRSYLIDQGWEVQEVADLIIFDISDGSKAAYYAATKDFAESASVMRTIRVPGHEISFNGNRDTDTKRPIILFRAMDIEAVVDMCHRYTDEQILAGMDSNFHHPIVARCASRFDTGLDASSEMDARAGVTACTDFAAQHAAEDVSEILAFDVPLRSNVIVPADSNIPPGNAAKLDQQVLRLNNWVKSVEGHATPTEVYLGATEVTGAIHGSLGSVLPFASDVMDPTDPQKSTRDALQMRYRGIIDSAQDMDLTILLSKWQYDIHAELLKSTQRINSSDYLRTMVTQDAIEILVSKIDSYSDLFDIGCALSPTCGRDSNTGYLHETSITKVWRLFQTLLDDSADNTYWNSSDSDSIFSIANDNSFKSKNKEAINLLVLIGSERDNLKSYVSLKTGISAAQLSDGESSFIFQNAPEIQKIYAAIKRADMRRSNYALNNAMKSKDIEVRTGLDHYNIFAPDDGIVDVMLQEANDAEVELNIYMSERIQHQRERLQYYDNNQQITILENQVKNTADEIGYQLERLTTLRRLLLSPQERKSEYLAEIADLSTNSTFINHLGFLTTRSAPLIAEISSDSAKLVGDVNALTSLSTLGVDWDQTQGSELSVTKGSFVTLDISGEYAPDCAIRVFESDLNLNPNITYPLVTDAQGFRTTTNSGYYEVESVSKSESSGVNNSGSQQACAGVGAEINVLKLGIDFCLNSAVYNNNDTTTSNNTGNEFRYSASFVEGLRVESHVPFPEFPVGSLILVGAESDISSPNLSNVSFKRVLSNGQTAFIAPKNLRLYLVLNDQSHSHQLCGNTSSSNGYVLNVNTNYFENISGDGSKVVADEMIASFADAHELMDNIAETDTILSTQLNSLRLSIRNRFYNRFGGESSVPEGLRLLFVDWLEQELASIELRVLIEQQIKAILVTKQELDLLELQISGKSDRNGYLEKILSLSEERFFQRGFFSKVQHLAFHINYYVMPLLWLKFGEDIHGFSNVDLQYLEALTNTPNSISSVELTNVLTTLFGSNSRLYNRINDLKNNNSGPSTNWVALYYPKSELSVTSQVASVKDSIRTSNPWSSLGDFSNHDEMIKLEVAPEDLYLGDSNMGYHFVLSCNKVEPILLDMAILFVAEGVQYTEIGTPANQELPISFESQMTFARANEPRDYFMNNSTYQGALVKTGFIRDINISSANPDSWMPVREPGDFPPGRGLSPFMTVMLSESFIYSNLFQGSADQAALDFYNDIDGILLFLKIQGETTPLNAGISWIPECL